MRLWPHPEEVVTAKPPTAPVLPAAAVLPLSDPDQISRPKSAPRFG